MNTSTHDAFPADQHLLRIATRLSQLGAWQVELPSGQLTWSHETAAIHDEAPGFSPNVAQALAYYAPETRETIERAFDACVAVGSPFDIEGQIITAKHRRVWVRALGEAVRDATGQIVRVQGAFQDISWQKEAEQKLRRDQSLIRLAGRISRVGGWAVSIPGNEVEWSEELWEILGYPPGVEPSLEAALEHYLPGHKEAVRAALSTCASAGTPFDLEVQLTDLRGRPIWARLCGEAERDPAGNIVQVHGAFADITQAKLTETELRKSAARLEATLESITDAFFTLDTNWRFTYANREADRVLRRIRGSLLGTCIWEEFPAAINSIYETEYRRAVAQGVPVNFEAEYAPMGAWFSVHAYPSAEGLAVYFQDVTARRQAEQALRAQEEELRAVAEAIPQIVWIARPDGWHLHFNQRWMDFTGLTLEESLGHGWNPPFHPEDRSRAAKRWREATESGQAYEIEYRLRRADGVYHWMLGRALPLRDASGQIVKWFGTCTDIHDLKEAEERAHANEQELRELTTALDAERTRLVNAQAVAKVGSWEAQFDFETLVWSAEMYRILEYGKSTPTYQDFLALVHPEDRQHFDDAWHQSIEARSTGSASHRAVMPDGRIKFIEERWQINCDDQGRATGAIGTCHDVTERKKGEAALERTLQQLEQSRAMLELIIESIPVRVFWKDRDLRFLGCNTLYARDAGVHDRIEILGKTDFELAWADYAEAYRADDRAVIESGVPRLNIIERVISATGAIIWVETSKVPFRGRDGELLGVLGVYEDITQRRAAEAERAEMHERLLEASHQAGMAEVATSVLHNVGNALNSVNVSAAIARESVRRSSGLKLRRLADLLEQHRDDLASFAASAQGAALLPYVTQLAAAVEQEQRAVLAELETLGTHVEHIKAIVATQQGYARVAGIFTDISAATLVEDALRVDAAALEPGDIHIVREYHDNPQLHVDKHRVLQILVNLISNARHAMYGSGAAGHQLTLRIRMVNDRQLEISVLDQGVGITPEDLLRIFEHGFTTRKNGHGFGLHSAALAAREVGGSLKAESEGKGRGAHFTLTLPIEAPGGRA